jgi:hypothetical protein
MPPISPRRNSLRDGQQPCRPYHHTSSPSGVGDGAVRGLLTKPQNDHLHIWTNKLELEPMRQW